MISPKGDSLVFVFMVSVFSRWWVEQRRLRFLRENLGAVCLVAFAGQTFSVQRRFGNQAKSVGYEAKLMLRNLQAASVAFHIRIRRGSSRRGSNCGISGAGLGCWKRQ